MLNGFTLQAAELTAAAYENMDGLCLFLCKECLEALSKLGLPQQVEAAVETYAMRHEEMFEMGTISELVLPQEAGLLTVVIAGCGAGSLSPLRGRRAERGGLCLRGGQG